MENKEFNPNWVTAAQSGDQEAFAELYRYSYRQVYLTIKCMVKSDEDTVMDLLQDTYIKSLENLLNLKDPSKYYAWIKIIARNVTLDYLKKKKPVLFSADPDEGSNPIDEVESFDKSNQPEAVIDDAETTRIFKEILDSLPDRQRTTVTMFYYLEMSVKDIARALGIPEATVKTRLHNGRVNIKNKIIEVERRDNIKLHGIAPIVFFLFLFQKMDTMAMEPDMSLLSSITNVSASTLANPSATGNAVGKIAGSAKAVGGAAGKSALVKVIGGVALVAAIGGAAYGIYRLNVPSEGNEQIEPKEEVVSEPEESQDTNEDAMAAYRILLQEMDNDSSILLQYCHLIDLNKDGIDELAVLSNDKDFNLYTYHDGNTQLLTSIEMASVYVEDWEYYNITYEEYEKISADKDGRGIHVTYSSDKTAIWVETTFLGDAGTDKEYIRISYDGNEESEKYFNINMVGLADDGLNFEYEYLIDGETIGEDAFTTEFQEYSSAGYGEDDLGLFLQGDTTSDNSGSVSSSGQTESSQLDGTAFDAVINEYSNIINGNETINDSAIDLADSGLWNAPSGASYIDDNGFFVKDSANKYYYTLTDIDGDGSRELIIMEAYTDYEGNEQPNIVDILSLHDGQPELLISGAYRNFIELCNGGVIKRTGSGGADAHIYEFYEISNGSIELLQTAEANWGEYSVNGAASTESEVNNILSGYAPIDLNTFDWTEL